MNAAFYGYRVLARFSEVLPGAAVRPLSRVAGAVAEATSKPKSRLVAKHLEKVNGTAPTKSEIRRTFSSYAQYWLDALRLPAVPEAVLQQNVRAVGLEHIEQARLAGRGAILAIPHLGNWDIAGAWLIKQGIPMTVVVERLEPTELRQWFHDFRTSLGMKVVVNDGRVGSLLLKALANNETIALLCDRDVDGSGVQVDFFGEETRLPKGPAVLALRSGAPIVPAAVYDDARGYVAVLGEPMVPDRRASMHQDVQRVTAELTVRIEELIRRSPTEWHLFQPNWPSDQ